MEKANSKDIYIPADSEPSFESYSTSESEEEVPSASIHNPEVYQQRNEENSELTTVYVCIYLINLKNMLSNHKAQQKVSDLQDISGNSDLIDINELEIPISSESTKKINSKQHFFLEKRII